MHSITFAMDRKRLPLRFETLDSPPPTSPSAAASSGREDPEIEALLEGFFTERWDASTSRETARSELETERTGQRDDVLKDQASRLQELDAAVDLAYADYIVQQRDFETPRWSRYGGDEAGEETHRTLPVDDGKDYRDDQTDPNEGFDPDLALDLDLDEDENRVIQFDVGGRVFRCKASVISKYPGKRLFQIVDGGCDRFLDTDTFFIDRSARNFETILDWYRTGRVFLAPGVNMEALEEDATYFGVYDEMFPAKAGEEKSCQSVSTELSARAQHDDCSSPNLRFSRRERHCLVPTGLPVVYWIRTHEQLVVASVKGHGKLMVRVCDPSGMQVVHVDQAVLFDSKTRFYLDGTRARLPLNALLPGDYVYTLWVEPHAKEVASMNGGATALDVEFNLLSTYSKGDLVGTDESPPQYQEHDTVRWEERAKGDTSGSQQTLTPVLFLPPFMQALYEQTRDLDTLVRVDKGKCLAAGRAQRTGMNLNAASPKPKINYVARAAAVPRAAARQPQPTNQATDLPSSPIQRTGAAIISPAKSLGTGRRQDGTITIHRPDKLDFIKRG